MEEQKKLFMWDIDGTLISVGGAGERAMNHAIKEIFGIDGDLNEIDYAGRTDTRIAHMLHEYFEIEKTEASIESFLQSYLSQLEIEMQTTRMYVLPGVIEALEAIEKHPNTWQGLLTGNLAIGAEIKLSHYSIWHYFPFGAFSDLSLDRNEIAKHAPAVAKKHTGIDFDPANIYVIGDTPHDIECGKVISAKTIAVCTGKYNAEDLTQHKPDFLFEELPAPEVLLGLQ